MTKDDYFRDGEEIRAIRKEFGLSQKEFGERLGVTHAHISKIEAGKERASETLLRLIDYEFGRKKPVGVPAAELTKPAIAEHLQVLRDIVHTQDLTDGCLFNVAFLLDSLVNILKTPIGSERLREMLLDSLGCLLGDVSFYLLDSKKENFSETIRATHFERLKIDMYGDCDEIFALLENHGLH